MFKNYKDVRHRGVRMMNKEIYFEPYNEPYFESPDDVPVKISKNALL